MKRFIVLRSNSTTEVQRRPSGNLFPCVLLVLWSRISILDEIILEALPDQVIVVRRLAIDDGSTHLNQCVAIL
ncbi:hypothetical protein AWB82_04469 [Caballeronia glebae]|uniref:Uncharacterized protein n=1 Tax=Caballeronia glebae TaxID=1777143 RepID=A0A158BRU8_9BURK|nr:hypothetical protein AWB82_04469 [Caballeronia glebae]